MMRQLLKCWHMQHVWTTFNIRGDNMSLKFTQEWADELLGLANKDVMTDEEFDRFVELFEMAKHTQDKKVVQTLMKCLKTINSGVTETIYNTLSSASYEAYYLGYFQLLPELLNNDKYDWLSNVLIEMIHGNEYTEDELNLILNIAKENLTIENIEKLYNVIVKDNPEPDEEDDGIVYVHLFNYLEQTLKEAGKL